MICCCSLAGTAACQYCTNNPDYTNNMSNIKLSYDYSSLPYDHSSYEYIYNHMHEKNKANPIIQYWCSNCDAILTYHQKYCHNCGKEIDWEQILQEEE